MILEVPHRYFREVKMLPKSIENRLEKDVKQMLQKCWNWGQVRDQEMPRSVRQKLVRDPVWASLDLFWLSEESRSSLECFCGCLDAYLVLFRCFWGCLTMYFGVVRGAFWRKSYLLLTCLRANRWVTWDHDGVIPFGSSRGPCRLWSDFRVIWKLFLICLGGHFAGDRIQVWLTLG